MIKALDALLGRITMYRLTLYYLIGLLLVAVGLAAMGQLSYNPWAIVLSASYLTFICYVSNKIFGWVYETPTNIESPLITALILSLIITPTLSSHNLLFLTAAAGLAIASKYLLATRKRHIFNPAAVAVALTAAGAGQAASWWVGTRLMLPAVFIGGVLVARKIQRGRMITTFIVASLVATAGIALVTSGDVMTALQKTVLSSSLFFLAFVMFTEPMTAPPTEGKRQWYAVLVGALFPPQVHILSIYSTPELALLVGNAFSYLTSPGLKLLTKLTHKVQLAPDTMDFVFKLDKPIHFIPGQYMEWTLPHTGADARGNRRYFTLASSPTENNVRIGVKFYPDGSSYKRAMQTMVNGAPIAAGQLGGDFTLPKSPATKVVFIAGGIGITPYRSMLKYLIDTGQKRPITVLYSERNASEVVYTDVLEAARQQLGMHVVYTLTDRDAAAPNWAHTGTINAEMIKREVPDYSERLFYVSGSHGMVIGIEEVLKGIGVKRSHIKKDFFPGYV